jgi:hypothetical protein
VDPTGRTGAGVIVEPVAVNQRWTVESAPSIESIPESSDTPEFPLGIWPGVRIGGVRDSWWSESFVGGAGGGSGEALCVMTFPFLVGRAVRVLRHDVSTGAAAV